MRVISEWSGFGDAFRITTEAGKVISLPASDIWSIVLWEDSRGWKSFAGTIVEPDNPYPRLPMEKVAFEAATTDGPVTGAIIITMQTTGRAEFKGTGPVFLNGSPVEG